MQGEKVTSVFAVIVIVTPESEHGPIPHVHCKQNECDDWSHSTNHTHSQRGFYLMTEEIENNKV